MALCLQQAGDSVPCHLGHCLHDSVGVYSYPSWILTQIMLSMEMLWRRTEANIRTIADCFCVSDSCLSPAIIPYTQHQDLYFYNGEYRDRYNTTEIWIYVIDATQTSKQALISSVNCVTDDSNLFMARLWPTTHACTNDARTSLCNTVSIPQEYSMPTLQQVCSSQQHSGLFQDIT